MHPLDKMLALQVQGHLEEARKLSDTLENLGIENMPILQNNASEKIKDQQRKNVWFRHNFNRAYLHAIDYDYQNCYQKLEYGRELGVYGHQHPYCKNPLFNPSEHDIKNKTLLIITEGGLGDEIINVRFAKSYKELGAKKVIVACSIHLMNLFSRIDGVDEVINKFEYKKVDEVECDYWMPSFSASWVCGHTYETLPNDDYIIADNRYVEGLKSIFDTNKKKIGIRWAGNPEFDHAALRKFPVEFLLNISNHEDVQLYSFQRDDDLVDLPKEIKDLQNVIVTFDHTAAALKHLDLFITSCTSLAHLASSMGVETWVIVPILPYTIWAPGAPNSITTPWYKKTKIFRQKEYKKWNETFQTLYVELESKFNLKHIELPNEDKKEINLNLGCGFKKLVDHINIDKLDLVKPDMILDLNVFPWPFEDNSVNEINAKQILQYLGDGDIVKVIREMYRISKHNAKWLIEIPHWQNLQKRDPDIKTQINFTSFLVFDKEEIFNIIKNNELPFKEIFLENIDIKFSRINFNNSEIFNDMLQNESINGDPNFFSQHNLNMVNNAGFVFIVQKPIRVSNEEIIKYYEGKYDDKFIS